MGRDRRAIVRTAGEGGVASVEAEAALDLRTLMAAVAPGFEDRLDLAMKVDAAFGAARSGLAGDFRNAGADEVVNEVLAGKTGGERGHGFFAGRA